MVPRERLMLELRELPDIAASLNLGEKLKCIHLGVHCDPFRCKGYGYGTVILVLMLMTCVMSACATSFNDATGNINRETKFPESVGGVTSTPFRPAVSTPSPSPTTVPTMTATPTIMVCNELQGRIENHQIAHDMLPYPLIFRVYLPPCYDMTDGYFDIVGRYFSEDRSYPVLYMVHGQTYSDDQWDRLGVDENADRLISAGDILPFIIVMPYEEDSFLDPRASGFGPAFVEALIPWVDQQYKTCTLRQCRAIGGLSRGGAWAIQLGFSSWELFGAIGAHSTPPFLGYPYDLPQWLQDIPSEQLPRIYMDIGKNDVFRPYAEDFEKSLTYYQAPHEWYLFDGGHEESYWEGHVETYLRWYSLGWQQ